MGEYVQRVKRFFGFTLEEQKNIVIIILAFSVILGFNDGRPTFETAYWVMNFVGCFFVVALGFLTHVCARKVWGIIHGVRTEQQLSWGGIIAGLVIALLTGGKIQIYLPGAFKPYHISTLRPGAFRGGLNMVTLGHIAMSGPIANIVIAMFSKFFLFQLLGLETLWLDKFIFFNFLLAFFTMLPIPGQQGLMVFFGSRMWYVIGFGVIFGYVILFIMGILSLLGALAIGFVIWLMYYVFFERRVW